MWRPRIASLLMLSPLLVMSPSCAEDEPAVDRDPRLGKQGKVRFVGGGGCSDSTVIAVGATAQLDLEPTTPPLPSSLSARSSDASAIEAEMSAGGDALVLRAVGAGSSTVSLHRQDELYDELDFSAEQAHSATFQAADAVMARGVYVLKLQELYGACGEECPLLGSELLSWSFAPAQAMQLIEARDRTLLFRAVDPGEVTLSGAEPVDGLELVDHQLTVVDPADTGALSASVIVQLPGDEGEVLDPQAPPVTVPVGSLLLVEITTKSGSLEVPIAGDDLTWVVEAARDEVTFLDPDGPHPVEGPVFQAALRGSAKLRVSVDLSGKSASYDVTVE